MAFDLKSAIPVDEEQPQQKKSIGFDINTAVPYKELSFLQRTINKSLDADKEFLRGMNQGTSEFFGDLAVIKVPGAKTLQKISQNNADFIPESTNLSNLEKSVHQGLGRAIPEIGKFILTKKVLMAAKVPAFLSEKLGDIPAVGSITDSAVLAVNTAIGEFRKQSSIGEVINSSLNSAALGLAIPFAVNKIAEPIISKAFEIGTRYGAKAGALWVKLATGSEELAKDLMNNKGKYVTKFFAKVPSYEALTQKNRQHLDSIKSQNDINIRIFKDSVSREREELAIKILEGRHKLNESNINSKNMFQIGRQSKLADVQKSSKEAFENFKINTKESLDREVDSFMVKIQKLKDSEGSEVGIAIDNILSKDPFALVKTDFLVKQIDDTLQKFGMNLEKMKVIPKTNLLGSPIESLLPPQFTIKGTSAKLELDKEVIESVQKIVNTIFKEGGATVEGVPLGALQEIKQSVQQSAYSGGASLAKNVQKVLSGVINPARFPKGSFIGTNIEPEIQALASANKKFSILIPKYEEAIKNFTRTDAQGKPIADFSRSLNAAVKNDQVTIRQLLKADSALPQEDRIMPQVFKAANDIQKSQTVYSSTIRAMRRKLSEESSNLSKKIASKTREFNKLIQSNRISQARASRAELLKLESQKGEMLDKIKNEIDVEENFIKNQEILRSWSSPKESFFSLAQKLSAYSGLHEVFNARIVQAAKFATAGAIVSPRFAVSTIETARKGTAALRELGRLTNRLRKGLPFVGQ